MGVYIFYIKLQLSHGGVNKEKSEQADSQASVVGDSTGCLSDDFGIF
jgi:hypothetical protein